ncbi:hypothetical protein [Vibrio sp. F74]
MTNTKLNNFVTDMNVIPRTTQALSNGLSLVKTCPLMSVYYIHIAEQFSV